MGDVFNSGVHWPRGSQIRDDPDRSQSANRHYRKEFHRSSAYHSYQPNPQKSGGKSVSAASPFLLSIPGLYAPALNALRPAANAPLIRFAPTEEPVSTDFCMITGAAIVLKMIQIPRKAKPIIFCKE